MAFEDGYDTQLIEEMKALNESLRQIKDDLREILHKFNTMGRI